VFGFQTNPPLEKEKKKKEEQKKPADELFGGLKGLVNLLRELVQVVAVSVIHLLTELHQRGLQRHLNPKNKRKKKKELSLCSVPVGEFGQNLLFVGQCTSKRSHIFLRRR
jgi:hypothetical protein